MQHTIALTAITVTPSEVDGWIKDKRIDTVVGEILSSRALEAQDETITVKEAAERMARSVGYIRNRIHDGSLAAHRKPGGKEYLIIVSDLISLQQSWTSTGATVAPTNLTT